MKDTARRMIGEKRERETRTYTITSRPDHLDGIETLFWWINSTRSGHSGSAKIFVDGDGSARVEITREGAELKQPAEEVKAKCSGEAEFEVGLD